MTKRRSLSEAALTALAALLLQATSPAFAQADAAQARSLAASCSNCHGTNGAAAAGMVALAGYNKADLVKNMADFKSGVRPATIMHQLSKGYSDGQIEVIAGYFAAQKK
jgi:cytochrome subunit of sulfide dehydrogenase